MTSEDNPPEVTTPRKTRSEKRGLVVISRLGGIAAGVWVIVELTGE